MKLYAEIGFEDEQGKENHLLRITQDISEVAVGQLMEWVKKELDVVL